MSEFNHKDERIAKLFHKGLCVEQIARKLGHPDNTDRVVLGLLRKGLIAEYIPGSILEEDTCSK